MSEGGYVPVKLYSMKTVVCQICFTVQFANLLCKEKYSLIGFLSSHQ